MTIRDFINGTATLNTSFARVTIFDAGRRLVYEGDLINIPSACKSMEILQAHFIPGREVAMFVPQVIREVKDVDIM